MMALIWGGLAALGLAHAECTAIAGATVHLPEGPERGLTVVVDDGRIAATGRGLRDLELKLNARGAVQAAQWRGQDCAFVQASGRELTAGFVVVPSRLGLVEISLERGTRNDDPMTEDPIRAALVATDAYDPRSSLIAVNRMEGLTSAVVVPQGGFVSGHAGFVQLAGATQRDAVVRDKVAMVVNLPSASLAEGLRQLRELVADVRAWSSSPSLWDRGRPFVDGASRLDLAALVPVVRGRLPMLVYADRASDIEAWIDVAEELDLNLIIGGAAEGWWVADRLAEADIPVIIDPLVYGPGSFDERAARPDNAARLVEAGVKVSLTSGFGDIHNVRVLRQVAGNAVRGGLAHADALAAITSVPAEILGLTDRGHIEPGAVADLALWTGDPLELSTSLEQLWVAGESITLRSRQTDLAEKYLTLPATPAPLAPQP